MALNLIVENERNGEKRKIAVDPRDKVFKSLQGVKSYFDLSDNFKIIHDGKIINKNQDWSETKIENDDLLVLGYRREGTGKLPYKLWKKRIRNELKLLSSEANILKKEKSKHGLELTLNIEDVPAYGKNENGLRDIKDHTLKMILSRNYPYTPPNIVWISDIYHPNIKPEDTNRNVNFSYLKSWNFSDDLSILIRKLKELIIDPEFEYTLDYDICKEAEENYR